MCERVGWWWVLAARARENFGACAEAILPFGTERAELGAMIAAITRDEPKPRVLLLSAAERHESGGASAGAESFFLCTWARLCAKKMSARQYEFAFPAREGVFIIQISDGDARGRAT